MKFGIRFIGYVGSMREIVRLSVLAEEAGFDCVWFPHDTFMQNTWVINHPAASSVVLLCRVEFIRPPGRMNPALQRAASRGELNPK